LCEDEFEIKVALPAEDQLQCSNRGLCRGRFVSVIS